MGAIHGKKTGFWLDSSAGTLVDLSALLNNIDFPETMDSHESTTFGANSKTYVVGLADATISGEGPYDPTLVAHLAALKTALLNGTLASATFEYYPEGKSSGKQKFSGEAILTSYEKGSPVGDLASTSFELQVTGDVTLGTAP